MADHLLPDPFWPALRCTLLQVISTDVNFLLFVVLVVLIIALVVIVVMSIVPVHAIEILLATAPSSRLSFLLGTYRYRHERGGGLMFRRALCFEACFLEGGSNVP